MQHSSGIAPARFETVLDALANAVDRVGDQVFLDFGGIGYTFRDIDLLSNRLANALTALGLGTGETLVTLLDNGIDGVLCWFAANKVGAIWVPINTAYRGEFLRHQVSDAGARVMVCEADYLERIVQIADQLPDLRRVLVRDAAGAFSECALAIEPFDPHRGHDDRSTGHRADPRDIACLIYTSGTTGPSKGCMLSHNYLCNFSRMVIAGNPPESWEAGWSPLPMFHAAVIAGVIMPALLLHKRAAISRRFSVSNFWREVETAGATHILIMAAMLPLVAKAPDDPAMLRYRGRLRCVAGAPFTEETRAIWRERFGVGYINEYTYGMTEGCKLATLPYGEPLPPPGSSGRISDDFEVIIADNDGYPLPPDTPGEILFRPRRPHIMFEGYWRREPDTLHAWRNLWMHTGDIGRIDANGHFFFVDRKKDYLRRRGENISSFEMESIFGQHPAICDVAFHAVPSELGEDDLKITAVLHPGAGIGHEELCLWSIERLPYFAVPRYIEFRDVLPRNPVGRLLKYQLRDEGRTPATWDREESAIKIPRR